MRAAAAAAWNGLPLSPVTAAHLAQGAQGSREAATGWASVETDGGPWTERSREALFRLIGAGDNLIGVWRPGSGQALITEWFLEWAGVRNRPQRNAVHRFTVDRHRVQTRVEASSLAEHVSRPDLLSLTALLHDIGKRPGALDHSQVGA